MMRNSGLMQIAPGDQQRRDRADRDARIAASPAPASPPSRAPAAAISASSGTMARSWNSRIEKPSGRAWCWWCLPARGSAWRRRSRTAPGRSRRSIAAGQSRPASRRASAGEQEPVTTTCARPSPKIVAPQRPQPRRLELQADDEQQEHDAEFGDLQDLLAAGDQPRRRADGDAGGEIAEHGAEPEALEQRRGDHRAAEQQQDFGIDRRCRHCHAIFPALKGLCSKASGPAVAATRPLPHPLHKHGRNNRWCSKRRSQTRQAAIRLRQKPGNHHEKQRRCLQAGRPRRGAGRGGEAGRRRCGRRGGRARPLVQRFGAARQGGGTEGLRGRRHVAARLRRQAGRQRFGDGGSDPTQLAERAVAMAKVSPEDPYQGLADPALLAKTSAISISSTRP